MYMVRYDQMATPLLGMGLAPPAHIPPPPGASWGVLGPGFGSPFISGVCPKEIFRLKFPKIATSYSI